MVIREIDYNSDPEVRALIKKLRPEWDHVRLSEHPDTFHHGAFIKGKLKAILSFVKNDHPRLLTDRESHNVHLFADTDFRRKGMLRFLKKSTDRGFKRTSALTVDTGGYSEFNSSQKIARWFGFTELPAEESVLWMTRREWKKLNHKTIK